MKKTKIVCTIGPASSKRSTLESMARSGMNVARLAFSHGDHASHHLVLQTVREVANKLKLPIAAMQDLQGPRIRIGHLPDDGVDLKKGDIAILVAESNFTKNKKKPAHVGKYLPLQYPELYKSLKKGNHVLISDGLIDLRVQKVQDAQIVCIVEKPGVVYNHKGINLPGVKLKGEVITSKDKKDLAFGVKNKIDFVALSFVRSAQDILNLRAILSRLEKRANPKTKIISKIESVEAVQNFEEIVRVSDGVMIARGDLGIELDPADLPILQKRLIKHCISASKPVIVATQMLESMMTNPRPTRAEASDVANAVIDHTDTTMTSGETSIGKYPVEVVKIMSRIIDKTEKSPFDDFDYQNFEYKEDTMKEMSVFLCSLAEHIYDTSVRSILLWAKDDRVARFLSSLRMDLNVFVATHDMTLYRQMNLHWGIYPLLVANKESLSPSKLVSSLRSHKMIRKNEKVLFIDQDQIANSAEKHFVLVK